MMILVSPISADLFQRKPSNGSGFWSIFIYFCYIFDLPGAGVLSLEGLDHDLSPSSHGPHRLQSRWRFPVLEMFYWRRIVFDEANLDLACDIGGCQCLGTNHLNRCIYLISVAMAIYIYFKYTLYPYYIIIIHTYICDIYNIYYPYNISIHAVLHKKMWNAVQFHELESFESAQQMLGET